MATEMYTQCGLRREYKPGLFSNSVAFIPTKFAIKDKFLKIKNDKGEWENGWQVTGTGATFEKSFVDFIHQDAKRMREKDI